MKTSLSCLSLLTALALTAGVLTVGVFAADAAPAKSGWWIKIDRKKTEATAISFQIGTSKKERKTWLTWKTSDPVEFEVPAEYLHSPELHLSVTATPEDAKAWFAVFYRNDGVKHFSFDDDENHTMRQTDRDKECR